MPLRFPYITNGPNHPLQEGNKIFSGGADNAGRMFDVTTGQTTQVAQHDAPVKVVKWIDTPQAGILATGSWDKTIKVLDSLVSRFAVSSSFTCSSIGISEHQTLSPPCNYPKDVTPSMFNTLFSSLEPPNVTFKSSTSTTLTRRTRLAYPHTDCQNQLTPLFTDNNLSFEVANSCYLVLHGFAE